VFTITASSANGYQYLAWLSILIEDDINNYSGGQCASYYRSASNGLILIDDQSNWLGKTMGQPGVLSNNQYQLDVGASSAVLQGNTITLNLALMFLMRLSTD
jgi:hypothetical protein